MPQEMTGAIASWEDRMLPDRVGRRLQARSGAREAHGGPAFDGGGYCLRRLSRGARPSRSMIVPLAMWYPRYRRSACVAPAAWSLDGGASAAFARAVTLRARGSSWLQERRRRRSGSLIELPRPVRKRRARGTGWTSCGTGRRAVRARKKLFAMIACLPEAWCASDG